MKTVLIATLGVVAAGLGGVAWAAETGGTASAKPVLRLVDATPLTVRGVNFDASERVSVTARAGKGSSASAPRALRAAANGSFVARFPAIDANACEGFSVTAVGSNGDRASLGRKPGVCPPGPAEG